MTHILRVSGGVCAGLWFWAGLGRFGPVRASCLQPQVICVLFWGFVFGGVFCFWVGNTPQKQNPKTKHKLLAVIFEGSPGALEKRPAAIFEGLGRSGLVWAGLGRCRTYEGDGSRKEIAGLKAHRPTILWLAGMRWLGGEGRGEAGCGLHGCRLSRIGQHTHIILNLNSVSRSHIGEAISRGQAF
jgi:hypothetical protein